MKKLRIPQACLALLILLPSAADAWVSVEDFEGYRDVSEIPCRMNTDSPEAGLYLLRDPADQSNTVLHIFTGMTGVDWANTHVTLPVSDGFQVGPGQVATLYWRAYDVGPDNNWSVGMTDRDEIKTWSDYNILIKVTETSTVTAHHRRSYRSANPPCVLTCGVWNHFWLVVDYDAGTYNLWVQRAEDSSPVLQVVGRDKDTSDFSFRRAPEGELTHITMTSNSESPGSPNAGHLWYMDDFTITMGVNLTIPDLASQEN